MNIKFTSRLIIAALLAATPGPECYAALAAKTSVKAAPVAIPGAFSGGGTQMTSSLNAPSLQTGSPLLTPSLNTPAPIVNPTASNAVLPTVLIPAAAPVVPGETARPPLATRTLDAAVKDSVVAAQKDASVGDQKAGTGRVFDVSGKHDASPESSVIGSLGHAPSPLVAPTQNQPQSEKEVARPSKSAFKPAWSLKKRILTSAAVVTAASGVAYVLHALGMPEAAAGVMPILGLAGTLGNGSGPSAALVEKFHGHVAQLIKPGQVIDNDTEQMIAQEMGLDSETAGRILLQLASENKIAAFNNGTFILTDLAVRTSEANKDNSLIRGDSLAFNALRAINSNSPAEHAKSLTLLQRALDQYKTYEIANHLGAPARKQVVTLKQNAYIEVLGDVLRAVDKGMQDKPDTEVNRGFREKIKAAQGWVNRSYFSGGVTPEMLDASSAEWLAKIVEAYVNGLPAAVKAVPEVMSGFEMVKDFVDGLGPEPESSSDFKAGDNNTRKMLTSGTGSGSTSGSGFAKNAKNFPLYDKNDSRVKALSQFATNLTGKAVNGDFDENPLIGRKKEIRQMVKTLLRVEKNNPLVIGEKGVGKTKIVDGLAQMIVDGQIPELAGKNIYKLDLTAIVAGTKYRGEFEERMKNILDEVKASKGQIILFIDEIHRILGAGSAEGANDAAQILKDSLSTGEIAVIGATTMKEYRKIEADGALSRRFNAVKLESPSPEEAVEILMGVKSRYEKKHKVTISEKVVRDAVAQAVRYITDRGLPDSVLDLIDDASAEVELRASESKDPSKASREVTTADIGFEISLRTGIPAGQVSADDMELLKSLPEELQKRLVGQDAAIQAVVRAIRRGRLGYRDTKRPVGVFALLGPTGVGKTHLARTLAKHLFRSEKAMVRIDMSEYKEKFAMSRLIGAPPGYVGHEGEGQLTEPVRRNPFSVVLFDEIDKADPEVLDLLLQILDDGRITDSQGRVIDFSNTIIMMSANTGGSLAQRQAQQDEKPRKRIGFITDDEEKKQEQANPSGEDEATRVAGYIDAFKKAMRPEFFNRIGKRNVIVFNTLGRPELEKILEINIADLNARLKAKNMTVELTDAAKKYLVDDAFQPENRNYGARPLNQTVENELETSLVDAELNRAIANGDSVLVDVEKGALVIKKK